MNERQLEKYLADAAQAMLLTVAKTDLTQDGRDALLVKKLNNMLNQFGRTIQDVLPRQIITEYFGSVDAATRSIIAGGGQVAATFALTPDGLINREFQKVIHVRAVEKLVDDAMLEIGRAISTTRNSSAAAISKTVEAVKADMVKGLIVGDPQRVMQAKVMESFMKDGLTAFTVVDKNGMARNLPLNFYAQTVTRSKIRQATVGGSRNRYKETGMDLVIINGNGDSCEICSQFIGMVVSLEGQTPGYPREGENGVELPPYHPSCRCGISAFVLEAATPSEIEKALEVNDGYEPGKDRRTPEQKRLYDLEQAGRRKANAELKQYAKYQAALGAEAPKTIGAFRNMKRRDTEQYRSIKSQFASYAQANRKVGK